jgi:hypothetical protein
MEMFVTGLKPEDDKGGSVNMICFTVFDFMFENAWLSLDRSIDN